MVTRKAIALPYKLLIYDIETSLLLAWVFSLGENVVKHNQLVECFDMFGILTISYKWYGEKETHILSGKDALEEFDKVARTADVIIGKNNFRFDDKRLNTERLIKGLPPFPEWATRSDDLESQLRKYFAFPSYSLDALSKYFGFGGKAKMELDDWKDINKYKLLKDFEAKKQNKVFSNNFCLTLFKAPVSEIKNKGSKALAKMGKYNGKDVRDTEALLKKVLPYIKLKYNAATLKEDRCCTLCGSYEIIPTKIVVGGATRYQEFYCKEHEGYAGKSTFKWNKQRHKVFGKMTK